MKKKVCINKYCFAATLNFKQKDEKQSTVIPLSCLPPTPNPTGSNHHTHTYIDYIR